MEGMDVEQVMVLQKIIGKLPQKQAMVKLCHISGCLEKAFGVSMDLLLRMQAGYDAAQARKQGSRINVKRFEPELVQS
jgi:hypothetical protein